MEVKSLKGKGPWKAFKIRHLPYIEDSTKWRIGRINDGRTQWIEEITQNPVTLFDTKVEAQKYVAKFNACTALNYEGDEILERSADEC